ncbi:MAG: right-handed parallel beta-helix repeat-containing protein, partial [Gemmatimonadaceae bacterium]
GRSHATARLPASLSQHARRSTLTGAARLQCSEAFAMRVSVLVGCALLVAASRAFSATIHVSPDGSGDYPTIQAAIDAAASGDEIVLSDGTFTGTGNWDLAFGTKDLVVRSVNGFDATTIDCGFDYIHDIEHRASILEGGQTSETRIEGITLEKAHGERDGGFIRCVGVSPIMSRLRFLGAHTSGRGGSIFIHGGSPLIEDCEFGATHDYAIAEGGAIFSEQSRLNLQRCSFTSVHSYRGAVALDGGTLADCVFDHCLGRGDNQDDCIGVRGGQVSVLTSTFRHTFGTCVGSSGEQLLLSGCRFEDNVGDDPGIVAGGRVTIRHSLFLRNSSGMSSSAVLFVGESPSPRSSMLSLDHCVFESDTRDAVVVYGSADLDVTHCTFAGTGLAADGATALVPRSSSGVARRSRSTTPSSPLERDQPWRSFATTPRRAYA